MRAADRVVRHDSTEPGSPLEPGQEGNEFRPELTGEPDLLATKETDSAFYGEPDLHAWLQARSLTGFAVCGIQTSHCVETTARMGGNSATTLRSWPTPATPSTGWVPTASS